MPCSLRGGFEGGVRELLGNLLLRGDGFAGGLGRRARFALRIRLFASGLAAGRRLS